MVEVVAQVVSEEQARQVVQVGTVSLSKHKYHCSCNPSRGSYLRWGADASQSAQPRAPHLLVASHHVVSWNDCLPCTPAMQPVLLEPVLRRQVVPSQQAAAIAFPLKCVAVSDVMHPKSAALLPLRTMTPSRGREGGYAGGAAGGTDGPGDGGGRGDGGGLLSPKLNLVPRLFWGHKSQERRQLA